MKGGAPLEATAAVAVLVCRGIPLVDVFIVEVLLGLFLADQGATDGVPELGPAFIGVLDNMDEIAAESIFVDKALDFQR